MVAATMFRPNYCLWSPVSNTVVLTFAFNCFETQKKWKASSRLTKILLCFIIMICPFLRAPAAAAASVPWVPRKGLRPALGPQARGGRSS